MEKSIKCKRVLISELTRESLYQMYLDNWIVSIPINKVDDFECNKDVDLGILSKQNVRYFEEKISFLNILFEPGLPSVYSLVKNSYYDYMIGFLQYISSKTNFDYTFGLFKDRIKSFERLIGKWDKFLDDLVMDISSFKEISLQQIMVLEIENLLRFYIEHDRIINFELNMDNFDRIFTEMGKKYSFRIYITRGREKQVLTTGFSYGGGVESGLCHEVSRINDLVASLQGKKY